MKVKSFFGYVIPVLIGIAVALILKNYVFFNITVPTGSMEPTILAGDMLIGSKVSYYNEEPSRCDVVIFRSPEDDQTAYVKRIIGLPGEKITIVDGKVYINDNSTPLNEEYLNPKDKPTGSFGPYTVPEGCYFVLGDNRNNSHDSRYWETTSYVARESIIGKVALKYYSSGAFNFNKIH